MDMASIKNSRFDSRTVTAVTGTKQGTLSMWVDRGFVHPTYRAPKGSGYRHGYSFEDVVRIMLLKRLVAHGITLASASMMIFRTDGNLWVHKQYISQGIETVIGKPDEVTWYVFRTKQNSVTGVGLITGKQNFVEFVSAMEAIDEVFTAINLTQAVRGIIGALQDG